MAAVTLHSDFGAQEKNLPLFPHLIYLLGVREGGSSEEWNPRFHLYHHQLYWQACNLELTSREVLSKSLVSVICKGPSRVCTLWFWYHIKGLYSQEICMKKSLDWWYRGEGTVVRDYLRATQAEMKAWVFNYSLEAKHERLGESVQVVSCNQNRV